MTRSPRRQFQTLERSQRAALALRDIDAPVFLVATEKDHIAPWRSVYKFRLFDDTEITFMLTTGGHNAGIVSEPSHPRRSFHTATSGQDDKYVDPDSWLQRAERREGSWWPAWSDWLGRRSSPERVPLPRDEGQSDLGPAPGSYVFG